MPQAKGNARYRIYIPAHDTLGNELPHLGDAAHQHLWASAGFERSHTSGPHRGNYRNNPAADFYHFETAAPDIPESDSHVKQLAHHIGDIANHPYVHVEKTGSKGVEPWVVTNMNHDPGWPSRLIQ